MNPHERIERIAETATDLLDAQLLDGELTQADYDAAIKRLNTWIERQYCRLANISTAIH